MAIPKMAEYQPPQRSGDEANGKAGKSTESADHRVGAGREEQRTEHQGSGGTVEKEVVPLQGVAEHRSDDDAAQRPGLFTVSMHRKLHIHAARIRFSP